MDKKTNSIIISKIKEDISDAKWITPSEVTEYLVEKRKYKQFSTAIEVRSVHITLQDKDLKVARIYIENQIGSDRILFRRLDNENTNVRFIDPEKKIVIGYLTDQKDGISGPINCNIKDIKNIHKYFQFIPMIRKKTEPLGALVKM